MGAIDNPKALRVSLTKKKLSELSVAKSHSLYELPTDDNALDTRPWRNLPKYFTQVLISTVALVKMCAHAKLGGSIEIMGMLTGKIVGDLFIVMDVYSLPVEGTETRVNAQSEAYEFMVQYLDNLKEVKPKDSIVGWYHSHPGYGCWLSGIDVATQSLNQNFQDPYLAIVVDPSRTLNQGKVEIGAFRTFPVGYTDGKSSQGHEATSRRPAGAKKSPENMGAHSDQYYSLDIKLFKGPHDDEIVNSILDKSWISGIVQTKA
ncbi:Mov34-domain-containing protein, partial [Metschnikowia bicuspidata var. bicuspidata NRRL YB-4993]